MAPAVGLPIAAVELSNNNDYINLPVAASVLPAAVFASAVSNACSAAAAAAVLPAADAAAAAAAAVLPAAAAMLPPAAATAAAAAVMPAAAAMLPAAAAAPVLPAAVATATAAASLNVELNAGLISQYHHQVGSVSQSATRMKEHPNNHPGSYADAFVGMLLTLMYKEIVDMLLV